MTVQSSLEAVVSILKPLDSVEKLVHSFLRTITPGNAEEIERLNKAIEKLTNSIGEILSSIQTAGISMVAGPYGFTKGMFITLVGCASGG